MDYFQMLLILCPVFFVGGIIDSIGGGGGLIALPTYFRCGRLTDAISCRRDLETWFLPLNISAIIW